MERNLRRARAEDLPRVMAIAAECSTAAQWSCEQYERLLTAESREASVFLVITNEEGVSGFLVGRLAADEWEISNIAIEPGRQRTGLGSALLREFLKLAREQARTVFLEVRASNLAARKLYQKLDFREIGRRKSYYHNPQEDAILLQLSF
jgi:ribosomal-protein-alanine N-acetyltransferase